MALIGAATLPLDVALAITLAVVAGAAFAIAIIQLWDVGGGMAGNPSASPGQIKCLEMHVGEDPGGTGGASDAGSTGNVPVGGSEGQGGRGGAAVSAPHPGGSGGFGGGSGAAPGGGGGFGSIGCGMGGEVILPTMLIWWFYRRRKK
jgi:hypothetical protein